MSGASEDSADTVLSVPSFGRMHRYHHDNRTFGRSLLQHEMEMRFLTLSSPTLAGSQRRRDLRLAPSPRLRAKPTSHAIATTTAAIQSR